MLRCPPRCCQNFGVAGCFQWRHVMAIVCMHAVMLCSELGTVRLTSIYYRVTGNQELLTALSETLVRLVEKTRSLTLGVKRWP